MFVFLPVLPKLFVKNLKHLFTFGCVIGQWTFKAIKAISYLAGTYCLKLLGTGKIFSFKLISIHTYVIS
jgi:hypothetical protein